MQTGTAQEESINTFSQDCMNPARPVRTAIRQLNPTCYLVTSESSRRTAEVAAAAARAGAGIVQVRAKDRDK